MRVISGFENFESAVDASLIRERLQNELGNIDAAYSRITDLFIPRVFPSKNGGLVIQYELYLRLPGSDVPRRSLLCGYLPGPGRSLPDYAVDSESNCLVFRDINLVIPVFPYDPGLGSLDELTRIHPGSMLSRALGTALGSDLEITGCELLGYRLEKRCVIRYEVRIGRENSGRRRVVAKALRKSAFRRSLEISNLLENNGFGRVSMGDAAIPGILGSDAELNAIFMEEVPGYPLHSLLEKNIFPEACAACGQALRKLRAVEAKGLKIYRIDDELGNLKGILELIGYMYPQFDTITSSRLDGLSVNIPEGPVTTTFSHRDFYDKQFIYSASGSTILDFDNAAAADPALDIGNFIAHLVLRKLQHPQYANNIDKGIEAFIASCDIDNIGFYDRISWWTSSSLLRLFALYLLRPRWRELAPGLLNQDILNSVIKLYGGAYER